MAYLCYAYATYTDRADFDSFHAAAGEVCSYDSMREEIAHEHFDGDASFSTQDLFQSFDMAHSHDGHDGFDGHDGGGGDGSDSSGGSS